MTRSKEHGSLTGSKRYKAEKEARVANSSGAKAKKLAEQAGADIWDTSKKLQPVTDTISDVANGVTTATASTASTVNNVRQALVSTGTGYQQTYTSSQLQHQSDVYGSLKIPEMDFQGLVPTDLLHPSGLPKISQDELTSGLAEYAGAKRAMELYQAGFQYINEVGKTKQEYHKAQQSIIKASTEQIKVNQEIVGFDKQNVELAINREKLEHSNERLKQTQITTTALANETSQLALKFEAQEGKRDAEINSIKHQTQDIIQRYLKGNISISG